MLETYRRSLIWALDNSVLMLMVLLFTIALNVVLIIQNSQRLFPAAGYWRDRRRCARAAGCVISPRWTIRSSRLVGVIKSDPAVANVNRFYRRGRRHKYRIHLYRAEAAERAQDRRPANHQPVAAQAEPLARRVGFFAGRRRTCASAAGSSAALYQYTIQSDNVQDLSHWGPILLAEMKKLPGLQDVNSDQQNGGLGRVADLRPGHAPQDWGRPRRSLDSSLYSAFGQSEVSIIYTQLNQYYVVLEVAPEYWQTPEGLKDIYLRSTGAGSQRSVGPISNRPVRKCAALAYRYDVQRQASTTPLAVNHTGLFPSVTVSFNLAPGVSLSDATQRIEEMQQRLGTPSTVRGFFAGTAQAYQQSLSTEPMLVSTALLAVYIVLGIFYESLVHPLTIISTLPSASVGAMLALMLFKIDLNVISIIGIVLLIGIVKKNAIMMIDLPWSPNARTARTPRTRFSRRACCAFGRF